VGICLSTLRISRFLVAVAVTTLVLSPLISAGATTSQQGYVKYEVKVVNSSGTQNTLTLNETVSATSQTGLSVVKIQITSQGGKTLTYSREVNSSLELFPILVLPSGHSFSYQSGSAYFKFNLTKDGSGTASFNGQTYQTTNYLLTVSSSIPSPSSSGSFQTFSANGILSTLPSGLLYSLSLSFGRVSSSSFTFQANLVATSLSVSDPMGGSPPSSGVTTGLVLAGIGAAAVVAVAIPWKILRGRKGTSDNLGEPVSKPPHWVD
jgi:hypothetical protein